MSQPFDNKSAAEYGHFVEAAYQTYAADSGNLTPAPLGIPAGWTMVAWIQMSDFGFGNVEPKFYGFIAQNQLDANAFVVAIRGTEGPFEWWDDAHILSMPFDKVPDAGRVARGFNTIYNTLKVVERTPAPSASGLVAELALPLLGSFADQVGQIVRRRRSRLLIAAENAAAAGPSFVVTGHSLGAALCTLYVAENASKKILENPVVCTFASPRVGNAQFARTFDLLGLTSWRIVNAPDLVPNLPPDIFGYVHVDTEALFSSVGKVKSTLGCAHAMTTYLSLVDPAESPSPDCIAQSAEADLLGTPVSLTTKNSASFSPKLGTSSQTISTPGSSVTVTVNVS